jgi:hypothetical protein
VFCRDSAPADFAGRLAERLSIEAEGCLRKPDSSAFFKKKISIFFFGKTFFLKKNF